MTPARVVRPRGAHPDAARCEPDAPPKTFVASIPVHTSDSFCTVCKPERCTARGCGGWRHKIYSDGGILWCGKCGRIS